MDNSFSKQLEKIGIIPHNEKEPLYKYVTMCTFKKILENTTLRFGNPAYYNDPFEFSDDCFDFEIEEEDFRALLRYNLSQAPVEKQREFEPLIATFAKQDFIDLHKKRIEAYKQTALVFCSTVSPLNRLMWAHYTKDHQGICFGIKIPIDIEDAKEMVVTKSVKYNPQIDVHTILTEEQKSIMMAVYNWIYSKSEIWGYEEEMRTYRMRRTPVIYDKDYILPPAIEYEDIRFDKDALVEVHYGINTLQADIDEIESLIKRNGYNNITRYRMQKIKGTYKIERVKV